MSDIVITGVGVVSPLGIGIDILWNNLLANKTSLQHFNDLEAQGYRNTYACRVTDFEAPLVTRGTHMALEATKQAIAQSNIQLPKNTGVFLGSTLGESMAYEMAAEGEHINPEAYNTFSLAKAIANTWQLTGPIQALSTACTAGNYAVGAAMCSLQRGDIDIAIAGGAEPFSRIAMVGFTRSRAMATDGCKPFDANRTGMVLGEGAAIFILERLDDAIKRGATPLASVYALGLSCDAYHPTSPHPDGRGLTNAMNAAFKKANIHADDIDWVNIHGSGTRVSDAAESIALKNIFKNNMPLLSGSKGAIGHALGAASALELAVCVKGIATQTIPPTPGYTTRDADIALDCTTQPVQKKIKWVINNASAFGGLNASLLLGSCIH
ncbi:MAG: beta-ketoacyl-[acyl-carrier-protein] synthase family protein [Chitinophagaceae bacterium]|nr:beta-ketoacyl-[acyl-carrier-protein] synthase family protein [Chitinophagaceae bacterium]